jgi:hypothetical protein
MADEATSLERGVNAFRGVAKSDATSKEGGVEGASLFNSCGTEGITMNCQAGVG